MTRWDSNSQLQVSTCTRTLGLPTHPPHLQLLVEGLFGVHAKALAWARTACAPRTLLRRGLGDGRHEQRLDADARVVHLLLAKAGVNNKPGGRRGGVGGGSEELQRWKGMAFCRKWEQLTHTTPSMVMDVSAMLVEMTTCAGEEKR